jgi:hypothetical protein
MKSTCIIGIAAAILVAPAVASGQGGQGGTLLSKPRSTVAEGQAAGGGGRGGFVAAVESKITTGRPYSAEAVTERTQVLADGNRINVRSTTRVYRDGEGRTRRESLEPDGSIRSISISDPVGKNSYTLDPKTKIAYAAGGNVVALRSPSGTGTYARSSGGSGQGGTARVVEPVRVPSEGGVTVYTRETRPADANTSTEDLGLQNVEGVMATGKRTTTIIPAGQIGNAQELRIVSEQWFSDEIEALVMTRHTDPRSGENVYRLVNILRAEPDPALFQVPADYTVRSRLVRRPQ